MATTQTTFPLENLKGTTQGGQLRAVLVPVLVSGTYLTASKPNFDIAAALGVKREALSSINVKKVIAFVDGVDGASGASRYTASNANIVLSSTGSSTNNVCTFRIDSGATNGDSGGSEIADATALNHVFMFLAVIAETFALGVQ
jgi:hypothetical protein